MNMNRIFVLIMSLSTSIVIQGMELDRLSSDITHIVVGGQTIPVKHLRVAYLNALKAKYTVVNKDERNNPDKYRNLVIAKCAPDNKKALELYFPMNVNETKFMTNYDPSTCKYGVRKLGKYRVTLTLKALDGTGALDVESCDDDSQQCICDMLDGELHDEKLQVLSMDKSTLSKDCDQCI